MANKLSSTNIAELLEEHLKSINDINEVIVNSKIDASKVKTISNFVKPLNESITSLNLIQQELSSFNGSSYVSNIKVKNGVKSIISTLKTVLEELNGFEIDDNKMKEFQKSFKPISEVLKAFGEVNKLLSSTDIGVKNKVKTKIAIKGLVDIIKTINDNIKYIDVDKKAAKKLKSVTEAITELSESVKSLMFVAITAPILVMLSPLINKSISVIVSIIQKLAEAGDTDAAAQAATGAATIGEALAQFAKGILMFVLATMGGVVILLAIVAILALKVFMMIFNKLFDEEQAEKTLVAISVMQQMGKSMMVLSLTVLLWALTGILIIETMKEILVTILFVTLAIFVYVLLGKMSKYIDDGNKTMLLVAGTLVILSMTVLLWALTGELIAEEWKNILITVAFVTLAIFVFTLLGFLNKFIGDGNKSMLLIALTLVVLSLTVLLWAEIGQTVIDNWLQVLVVGSFVIVCIGILLLLGRMTRDMMKGAVALLVMAVGLVLLSSAAALMTDVGNLILDNWKAIFIMTAFIVLTVGIFAIIGIPAVAAFVALGAAVLLLMGAALLVFSISALIMVGVAKLLEMEDVTKIMSLISGLGVAVASLGILMPLIVLGSIAMGILGAALIIFMVPVLMFCAAVSAFKKMNATEEDIRKPVDALGVFINALSSIFTLKMLFRLPRLTASMLLLLPIVLTVGAMAKTLQDIASLSIPTGFDKDGKATGYNKMKPEDFAIAAQNASNIAMLLSSIFGDEDVKLTIGGKDIIIKPINKDALDNITRGARNKMERLAEVTTAIGNMANVLQNVASLNIPTKFDKNGKAIAYKQMDSEDFAKASVNAVLIMTILLKAVGSDELSKTLEELDSDAAENFAIVLNGCEGIQHLMTAIKESVDIDDVTIASGIGKIRTALSAYIKILNDLFIGESEWVWKKGWLGISYPSINVIKPAEIDVDALEESKECLTVVLDAINATVPIIDNLKSMSENVENVNTSKISDVIKSYLEAIYGNEKGEGGIKVSGKSIKQNAQLKYLIDQQERMSKIDVQSMKENTDTFIKFIDKANSIDTSKLKTVRDMFEQMANFSKSVHGDFDKLADILSDKLCSVLEKLQETLGDVINIDSTAKTNTPVNTNTVTKEENKNGNDKKLEKNLSDIKDSLDDMISLLTSVKNNTENYGMY